QQRAHAATPSPRLAASARSWRSVSPPHTPSTSPRSTASRRHNGLTGQIPHTDATSPACRTAHAPGAPPSRSDIWSRAPMPALPRSDTNTGVNPTGPTLAGLLAVILVIGPELP